VKASTNLLVCKGFTVARDFPERENISPTLYPSQGQSHENGQDQSCSRVESGGLRLLAFGDWAAAKWSGQSRSNTRAGEAVMSVCVFRDAIILSRCDSNVHDDVGRMLTSRRLRQAPWMCIV
jgi:hypothetical protein